VRLKCAEAIFVKRQELIAPCCTLACNTFKSKFFCQGEWNEENCGQSWSSVEKTGGQQSNSFKSCQRFFESSGTKNPVQLLNFIRMTDDNFEITSELPNAESPKKNSEI